MHTFKVLAFILCQLMPHCCTNSKNVALKLTFFIAVQLKSTCMYSSGCFLLPAELKRVCLPLRSAMMPIQITTGSGSNFNLLVALTVIRLWWSYKRLRIGDLSPK